MNAATLPTVKDISVNVTLRVETCFSCGVVFGMGDDYQRRKLNDKTTFYCPSGHAQHYIGKTEEETLRAEVERQKQFARNARAYAKTEREGRLKAQRERSAARGQVTKIKNRVGNGVCPCCNRTFVNLGRHIAGQHPSFIPGETS